MLRGSEVRVATAALGRVEDVGLSRDGKFVVTAGEDKTARVWQVSDGKLVATLRGHRSRYSAVFTEDGRMLVRRGTFAV